MIANVLTIAGTDPSGGAGIQADLKAFSALGAYGTSVITALVAQSTTGVADVLQVPPDFVARQIDTLFADVRIDAVKTGMLAEPEIVEAVARAIERYRPAFVVVDPVMVAKSGDRLLSEAAVAAVRDRLLPLADVITPNLPEAAVLAGGDPPGDLAGMREMAAALHRLGPRHVLLKGGHLSGQSSPDVLFDGRAFAVLEAPRIKTKNTHGTGCTLSAAIAALLPASPDLATAVRKAKAYLTGALAAADWLSVGRGHGPVHHFFELWPDPREETAR